MKKLLLIILLFGCSACRGKKIYYKKDVYTFYIAYVDPPKHFYIDVYRTEPTYLYVEHVYGRKWCSNWRNVKTGTALLLTEYLYYYEKEPAKKYREIWTGNLSLCD